jgi:hypothetical protein
VCATARPDLFRSNHGAPLRLAYSATGTPNDILGWFLHGRNTGTLASGETQIQSFRQGTSNSEPLTSTVIWLSLLLLTPSTPISWAWTTFARTSRRDHTATQAYASSSSRERRWPVNNSTSPLLEHLGEIVRQFEPMPTVLAENDGRQTTSVHASNWSAPCQLTSCTESLVASPDRLHPGHLPPNGAPQCHRQ